MKRRGPSGQKDIFTRETGSIRKKWTHKLPVALIFPSSYRVGMSNLGFQIIYRLLNSYDGVVCERFFQQPGPGQPLSIESGRPLADFSILFFSISFEQDYPAFVSLLAQSGMSLWASERQNDYAVSKGNPLVVAGGVATFINPEPLAPFCDLMVMGEAEPVLPTLMGHLLDHGNTLGKQGLLAEVAASLDGCYVPNLYKVHYHDDGTVAAYEPIAGAPRRVRKVVLSQCRTAGHSALISPEAEFADLFLSELGRGCSRGCRFCAAGYIYRPPRQWGPEAILAGIAERPEGLNKVGLLGMEMIPAEHLQVVADALLEQGCALSFSSLRADAITPQLVELLGKSGLKTATIAPDGPSERLRRVINKKISEDEVMAAVEALLGAEVRIIKLYFMIGLPTESEEDLVEMIALVKKIQQLLLAVGRPKGRLASIALSVNTFVPKAWTPFQYAAAVSLKEAKKKIAFLRKELAQVHNVSLSVDNPDTAIFQAVLARGDRRLAPILAALGGGSIRGWRGRMAEFALQPEFYAQRQRTATELFPWDLVDHGIRKEFLWQEYQHALNGKTSPGCAIGTDKKCRSCGVCNANK